MNSIAQNPVGNIVRDYPSSAQVFASYGIDFCCGGKRPLNEVCEKQGINTEDVVNDIMHKQSDGMSQAPRFNYWEPAFLCDYIENNHHAYVKAMIPVIQQFIHKVARVHGDWRPENIGIAADFDKLAIEMRNHLEKEEVQAFPLIRSLNQSSDESKQEAAIKLDQLIKEMENEHDGAGDLMRKIRTLSNDFMPPEDACNTYRAAYEALADFEKDLHQHVHLENNILFPAAQKMSREMQSTG